MKTARLIGFILLTLSVSTIAYAAPGRPRAQQNNQRRPRPHSIKPGMGNMQLRLFPVTGGYFNLIEDSANQPPSVRLDRGEQQRVPIAQTLGYWHVIAPRIKLGLDFGLRVDTREVDDLEATPSEDGTQRQKQVTSTDFIFAPGLRYYTRIKSSTALYLLAQFNLRAFDDGDSNTSGDENPGGGKVFNPAEAFQFGLLMGFGAEWFPVKRFSLSGEMGLDFSLARPGSQGFAMGTYLSSMSANFYF